MTTSSAADTWYVIYTKPRHEKKVAEQLDCMELQHFLPTVKTVKARPGKKKRVILPLFPSYLFVRPNSMQQYFDSLQIPGVLYYVKTGNRIAKISEQLISKIRSMITGGGEAIEISTEQLKPGEMTTIPSGPFTGLNCEVVRHHGKHKILVRIELLHRCIMVDLPVDNFAPRPSYN